MVLKLTEKAKRWFIVEDEIGVDDSFVLSAIGQNGGVAPESAFKDFVGCIKYLKDKGLIEGE
jgi:hypothetical protein